MKKRTYTLAIAAVALAGCGSDATPATKIVAITDAVTIEDDAGGGSQDAGGGPSDDAGGPSHDAVTVEDADTGEPDADAGTPDADAQTPDADNPDGPPDANTGGGQDAGMPPDAKPDAAQPPDAKQPDAKPDAKPPKPHVAKCQGETTTKATLKGTSGDHHVDKHDEHVTDYGFRGDMIEHCSRNWCKDNDPEGAYFTYHGGTGDVTWKTVCKPSGKADVPCVADITDHTPKVGPKFEDNTGKAQHFHLTSPHWPHWEHNHTCAYSGTVPNIEVQKFCNTTTVANSQARGDHIAYGFLFSSNHSSNIPAGVSFGIVAGPVFGAATYTPAHGNGTYGASRGFETKMGCKKVGEKELETMIVDLYEPVVIETKKHAAEANNENGEFADPDPK
jgi:hypothetical protein